MKHSARLAMFFFALFCSVSAVAGMRCENKLVSIGDNFEKVKNTCGEADSTYDMGSRVVYREVNRGEQALVVAESIKVDMWVYRFGENTFSRNLYFENGVLVKIELGDKG